jgi:hypothetical protein
MRNLPILRPAAASGPATSSGNVMSSSFLQGVAFFALSVIVLVAAFGGFGVA